jgi:hypothetical protein
MEHLARRICSSCRGALLYPHPELKDWLKCVLCGYSKLKEPHDLDRPGD